MLPAGDMSNTESDKNQGSGKLHFLLALLGVVALIHAIYAFKYAGFVYKIIGYAS